MIRILLLAFSLFFSCAASGAVIVNLAGDRDSFGTGKPDGSTVSVLEITAPGGEDGNFDQWALALHAWTHAFGVPAGTIVSATLAIATLDLEDNGAGDGLGGGPYDSTLFVDGNEVPGAFDAVFTPDATATTQITPNVTIFDLSAFLGELADGNLVVTLNPRAGTLADSISVDYAELRIVTTDAPEPATMALLGLGAIALAFARRKRS
jgi:hypothetical protein